MRTLKTKKIMMMLALTTTSCLSAVGWAAPVKTYEVTGPVLEVTDSSITVQKGKDKWQIARDKDTKVTGEPKVGDKVHIEYRMTAATVEVKDAGKGASKDAAKEKPAAPKK